MARANEKQAMTVEDMGKSYVSSKKPPTAGPKNSPSEYTDDHNPAISPYVDVSSEYPASSAKSSIASNVGRSVIEMEVPRTISATTLIQMEF